MPRQLTGTLTISHEKLKENRMEKNTPLVNKDYGEHFQEHLLEQYKLFVETSLDVTTKRLESHRFHLTLNSVVFGIASYLTTLNLYAVVILFSCVGILISYVWRKNLLAYKELNKAKFKVILELEAYLPACIFKYEEKHSLKKYHGLTSTEKWYPIIFMVLYVSVIIVATISPLFPKNVLPTVSGIPPVVPL
jgi:hypothetical protein